MPQKNPECGGPTITPPTRWAILSSFVIAWLIAVALLYSDVVKVLAARPWWQDLIVAVATVTVPILAFLELRHSAEANRLRGEANDERGRANDLCTEANRLREDNTRLIAALDTERNRQLEQIAANTKRPSTPAERNAEMRKSYAVTCEPACRLLKAKEVGLAHR